MENRIDIDKPKVYVVVYDKGSVFITDSRSDTMMFVQNLMEKHIAFKFIPYDTQTDYIVEA